MKNVTQVSLSSAFEAAKYLGYATVLWKLPYSSSVTAIVSFSESIQNYPLENPHIRNGFIISPFLNTGLQNNYWVRPDWQFSSDSEQNIESPQTSYPGEQEFIKTYKEIASTSRCTVDASVKQEVIREKSSSDTKKKYVQMVQKAIKLMEKDHLQKVVLSHPRKYPVRLEPTKVFFDLCETYPNAFVALFYLPDVGTWMCATPESLIRHDRNNILQTMALAGTQKYDKLLDNKEVRWSQKEIEEQAMVSRHIINCFKKIRLRTFDEDGPKTIRAGNLFHLRTNFSVDMKAVDFPDLPIQMLHLLHPTSAVCGMPTSAAMDFIHDHEGYDRKFYSGFLGPYQMQGESHLFVNLRCMEIAEEMVTLYVGAGITQDSDPEKEWEETSLKAATLLNLMQREAV